MTMPRLPGKLSRGSGGTAAAAPHQPAVPERRPHPSGGLVIDSLVKTFSRNRTATAALGPVSLDITGGAFVAVVGASGSGKTTLLRNVAGLIRPDAGEIWYRGQRVTEPVDDLGMVFQQPVLLDWYSVERNIALQLEVRNAGPAQARNAAARELLERVGLQDLAHRHPFELSGGQQQRVALCRALVHHPGLLLLDEPFGALDALTRERLQADLERLWMETSATVMFVTHDVSEAVLLADRVIVLKGPPGSVVADVPVNLRRPRLPSLDAGDPDVARLVREVRQWVSG
jgi:NitT/TauT family transport system ATP-binding protein